MGDDVNLTDADRGKAVVVPSGEVIGRVVLVQGEDVYVDVDPALGASVRTRLGWGANRGTYRLDDSAIDSVDEDEVVLDF